MPRMPVSLRFPLHLVLSALLISAAGNRAVAEPPHLRPEVMSAHRLDARLNEEVQSLPIDLGGERREFQMTIFRPDGPGPFPIAVVHHGRGSERAYPSRQRWARLSGYLVRRGFAVLAPTRVGYGGLRDTFDPEHSRGQCNEKSLDDQAAAIIAHTDAALAYARTLTWADMKRILLVGASVGGHGVIANGARPPAGLAGIVNFAGGAGGDPKRRPGNPCNVERFLSYFAKAARSSLAPTIWIYAENDRYWGPTHPVDWHGAYVKAGGRASLVRLPPIGDDGHNLVSEGFSQWRSHVDAFLAGLGFAPPRTAGAPPPSGYASLGDVDRLPLTSASARDGYKRFLSGDLPRAFVIGPRGGWHYKSGSSAALREALEACKAGAKVECRPYAVDDEVVWRP